MEIQMNGEEDNLYIDIEKQLLVLLSDGDDNQDPANMGFRVSKDPLYFFRVIHNSCNCCTGSLPNKRELSAKISSVTSIDKVLRAKQENGTGVFLPRTGCVYRKNKFKHRRTES